MNPIAVTASALELDPLIRLVSNGGGHGAVATFIGVVRDNNLNRRVTHLEYEAYEPMAVKALAQICREADREWPGTRLAVHHRIGQPGDRRSEHRDCGRERASRGGVRRVPLRDRAREADRADLEARIFRRRRGLDRRRDRQPGRRGGAPGSGAARMRVTVRLFAQAARHRRVRRSVARSAGRRDGGRRVARAGGRVSGDGALRVVDVVGRECGLREDDGGGSRRRRDRVSAAGVGWLTDHRYQVPPCWIS